MFLLNGIVNNICQVWEQDLTARIAHEVILAVVLSSKITNSCEFSDPEPGSTSCAAHSG